MTYLSSAGVGLLLDMLAGAPVPVTLSADPDGPVARILALTGIRPPDDGARRSLPSVS